MHLIQLQRSLMNRLTNQRIFFYTYKCTYIMILGVLEHAMSTEGMIKKFP